MLAFRDLGKKTIFAPSVVGKCSFISHKLIFAAWLGTKIAIFARGLGIVQSSHFLTSTLSHLKALILFVINLKLHTTAFYF